MKKYMRLLIIIMMIFPVFVMAEPRLEYRANENRGKNLTINGNKIHLSFCIDFNIESNGKSQNAECIDNFEAKYENDTFYVSIKRSEINKVFKNTNYDNVSNTMSVWADYLVKDDKLYYYFNQNNFNEPYYIYSLARQDYTYKDYKLIEVMASSVSIAGIKGNYQLSSGGEFVLFSGDEEPELELYPARHTRDKIDFSKGKLIFDFKKSQFQMEIIEDVQMDLGNIKNVVGDGRVDEATNEIIYDKIEKVDNYYAEYLDNNKLKYSWTMFDANGNPIELKTNTMIKIDDQEKQEEIYKGLKDELDWWNDISDHIKVLSFEHEGDLGGKAKISLYVGDKFKSGDILTLYYYNPEKLQLENISDDLSDEELVKIWEDSLESYDILVDKDGYITIELTHCSDYLLVDTIAKEKIIEEFKEKEETTEEKKENNKKNNRKVLYIISGGVIFVLIVVVIIVMIIKKKKHKKENTITINTDNENNVTPDESINTDSNNINNI